MFLRHLKSLLAGAVLALAAQSAHALQVGDKAPDFSLPSTTGGNIKLSDFADKKLLVIFFYNGAFNKG
jgi:thioredoxin-dependent peroxiredoxin